MGITRAMPPQLGNQGAHRLTVKRSHDCNFAVGTEQNKNLNVFFIAHLYSCANFNLEQLANLTSQGDSSCGKCPL